MSVKYTVVSDRVGTPGSEYHPEEGVNIDALLAGGFIQQTGAKSAKLDTTDSEKE